jgi:DNA-binding transcriptional MocR family regulator
MKPELVMASGSSSLSLMHETMVHAMMHGVPGGKGPWLTGGAEKPRFLCLVPGYDRHFSICEHLGLEMIPVACDDHGPDQAALERLVADDPRIKGMWIVPKYCNPTGVTLAPENVKALAKMKTAAPDFRVFWDNAYAVHDLTDTPDELLNGYDACVAAGNGDRFLGYASFSKVTFAGSSMSSFAASPTNIDWFKKHHANTTIGPDKLNQLRHVRFLKNAAGVNALMKKHAEILRPKFAAVERVLTKELGGTGLATWTKPRGGYFVSVDTQRGMATKVVKAAADAGVKLTPAGSSYPYRKDPNDTNIRIAPSFPSVADVERAMEVFAVAILANGG